MVNLIRMRFLMSRVPEAVMAIERAESRAMKVTGTISDMPRGSVNGSVLEESVIRISDLRDAYQSIIDELSSMRKELNPLIDRIDDGEQRAVMRLRYIDGYSVRQIGEALYKCNRQVYRYLTAAERQVNQFIDEDADV